MESKHSMSSTIRDAMFSMKAKVLMTDGTWKNLDELQSGDVVGNGEMRDTMITSVQHLPCHGKRIYAINGAVPFLTEEQAVMTQRGWCSLNPQATKIQHPMVRVGQLRVGDVVWKLNSDNRKTLEEVKNIYQEQAGVDFKAVLFHPRQGNSSVWINGLCVLVNDPNISLSRTTSNIYSHMSMREQQELKSKIESMRSGLEKSFGKSVVNTALNILQDPQGTAAAIGLPAAANHRGVTGADLKDCIHPALIVVPEDKTKLLPPDFKKLAVVNGNLVINGEVVPSYSQGNNLFWTRTVNGSIQESGTIQFSPARHHGVGVLEVDGQKITFSVFSEIDYSTVFTGTSDRWYEFSIQFTLQADQRVAIGVLMHKGAVLPSTEVTVTLSTTTDQHKVQYLTADIEWNPTWVAWSQGQWIAAEIQWATDYRTFTGKAYMYDSTQPLNRGQALPISGTAQNWQEVEAYLDQLKSLHMDPVSQPTFLELANSAAPMLDGIQHAMGLIDDTPLTVEALYSLAPPDMSQVHQNCFDTIKNMMLYAISDQQLTWFNETRPGVGPGQPLTQSEADLATQNTDINSFLVNDFALGYLTQAFSQSTDPKIKDLLNNPTTQNKLGYFWQGTGDQCFPRLQGYNLAAAHVMDDTYASMLPGFDNYLQDTQSNWGQQLYLYCLNSATLNGLAMQNMLAGGGDMINSLAMKLHSLSPTDTVKVGDKTVSYATSLYEAIVNVNLQNVSKNFTSGTQEDMVEYLTAFLQEYFTTLINGGGTWADDIRAAATNDLNNYMTENAIHNAQDLMANLESTISGFAAILVSSKSEPLTVRIAQFAQQYPKIAKWLGGCFTYAAYGLCFLNLYKAILNWKNLTPVQKAQVIITTAYGVVGLFNKFASYKAAKTLTAGGPPGNDQMNAAMQLDAEAANNDFVPAGDEIAKTVNPDVADTNTPLLIDSGKTAGDLINTAEGTEAVVSRWTSIANVSSKLAEGLGLIVMAGACVAVGFEIANDFNTGQPWDIKMLDILGEISNGVCFLISAGVTIAGLIGAEVASFIPVIGVVVAVIGIVISIILLFLHRNPPPTPEETFVQQHCVPFVNRLDSPPQKWLDQRANAQKHLDGAASGPSPSIVYS